MEDLSNAKEVAVGIDLGLDTSCIAVWRNGKVEVIPNGLGNPTTPSYIAFTQTQCLIGDAAKNQATTNPLNTIFGSTRLLGRKFDDEVVQKYIEHCPYKIVPSLGLYNDRKPVIEVYYRRKKKEFDAVEISAMILKKLKQDAEAYLGYEVKNAVITVPASFNNLQLQATKDAGVIAGFNVLRIIDEPTAAAMACGFGKKAADGRRNLLVFCLGRESCEVYLVEIEKDVYKVKSKSESDTLGSQNFDDKLVSYFVDEFKRKLRTNINQYPRVMSRLRVDCEKVNIVLSSTFGTTIEINSPIDGIYIRSYMSRVCWDKVNYELLEHCVSLVDQCLKNAKMGKKDVHDVVLVGGASSIPIIRQKLNGFFGKQICISINPNEIVASGAAIHAATIACTHPRKTTDIPLLLKDVDKLLNGFGDSKPIKPFPSAMKREIAEVLNRLKLDFSDIQLMKTFFLLLRKIDSFLPEHLRPALKGLEQTLLTCQQRFLEKAAEKKACFIDPQEVTSINADLTTSKRKIQSSSSYCDKLKREIADIDASIARLMDQRASLESDLATAQLNLTGLTDYLTTQMELTKEHLNRFSSFQTAEKLEYDARHSLAVALDCLGSFFASL